MYQSAGTLGTVVVVVVVTAESEVVEAQPAVDAGVVATTGRERKATISLPADWYKDPAGRYDFRYWDGSKWTENVSRAGVRFTDPATK